MIITTHTPDSGHTDLDEVTHSLDLILDGVALHQEGVVSVTVHHSHYPGVVALLEDRVLCLRLHE